MSFLRVIGTFAGVGSVFLGHRFSNWAETTYPPQSPPELPPQPGYKVFGYMGCPASQVEAISRLGKNLFFAANDFKVPQRYALSRTSLWDRCNKMDRPVVLQIEIREDSAIEDSDLWRDPQLTRSDISSPYGSSFVSYWPAIPPEVQQRCGLQVRIHHVVTPFVDQRGGATIRAIYDLWQKYLARDS